MVEVPRFQDNRHMKLIRSSRRTGRIYTSENICGSHFRLRLRRPQGRRIMSIKNCNDTIGKRTPNLPACSEAPQPTASPHAAYEDILTQNMRQIYVDSYKNLSGYHHTIHVNNTCS
jgi:hypothetical protein